jgi:hypothetical protein
MLGNQMGNQHLGFVQYFYGQYMICPHMGLLRVALQKGIKVAFVVHLHQLDDGPMLFKRYSIVANIEVAPSFTPILPRCKNFWRHKRGDTTC